MIGHVLVNINEVITNDYTVNHQAIDLVGSGNSVSDVITLEAGVVELVISNVTGTDINSEGTASYGNFVKIRHANGQKTLYAHLKYGSVNVKKGEYVEKGEKIGTMGATGKAYGVHLHFEVRNKNESRENPYFYLWGKKKIRAPISKKTNTISKPMESLKKDENKNVEIKNSEQKESEIAKTDNVEEINTETIEVEDKVPNEIVEEKKEVVTEKVAIKEEKTKQAENVYNSEIAYKQLKNNSYNYYSIVDALKEIGVDSSYDYRSKLAKINNIYNYKGTASQNLKLLSLLKDGKLLA